jgi:hypothetical protein
MTTYITDFVLGYVIAKRVSNIWLAVLAGVLLAIGNTVLSFALLFESGLFSQLELAQKFMAGIVLNPIFTLGSLCYCRRKISKDGYFLGWFKQARQPNPNANPEKRSAESGSVWRDLGVVGALIALQVIAGLAAGLA